MTISTWFFAIAATLSLASVLVGRPWTMAIALRSTARAFWDHPLFREANTVMTLLWALIFGLSAGVVAWGGPGTGLIVSACNAGLGALSPGIGRRYAAWRAGGG